MSDSAVPKPLSASVGLLLSALEDARGAGRSPIAQVVRLPLATAGQLLTARARYDQLAEQGEIVVEVVVGGMVGLLRSRFGSAADSVSEAADDAGEWLMDTADSAVDTVRDITERAGASLNGADAGPLDDLLDGDLLDSDLLDDDPLAADADVLTDEDVEAAVDAATETPEQTPTPLQDLESFAVSPAVGQAAGGLRNASDLPLQDFDHMTLPQLRGRLRRLDAVQLTQLLDYERAHANRVGILTLLENRLRKLDAEGPKDIPLI
jgi:hypothetical protein